jgi:hypothetical protein
MSVIRHIFWLCYGLILCGLFLLADWMHKWSHGLEGASTRLDFWASAQMRRVHRAMGQ